MRDFGRLARIVRVASALVAALLLTLAIFLLLGDPRRLWGNALGALVVALIFVYVAIRPESLPFLDDPAVPDDH